MRARITTAALALALIPASGLVAGPRERIEEARYTEPSRGHPDLIAVCIENENRGCVEFGVGPRDRKVSIDIADDTGSKPYFLLRQELETTVDDRFFCGSTDGFVDIKPNARIVVFVYATPSTSATGCIGIGTSGVVTATFRNR